jgi:NAD(P)-dependent dehydrogenase (short-subunit alcohol dehydrogenase family)
VNFDGKVAAVTGGGSGIGLALAEALAALGCRVAVGDVHADRLDEVRKRIPGALALPVDVADPAQLEDFAAHTEAEFGAVHFVCANAGILGPIGVVSTLRAFVPRLLRHPPGHVGITASMAAVTTSPMLPAYYATKHGLLSIADNLHLQFARDGHDVGVSVLLPAQVTTRLGESVIGGDSPGNPRGISPSEVADRFIEAVRSRRRHVFTHPGSPDLARARAADITDEVP